MICAFCKLPDPTLIVEKDLLLPDGTSTIYYATLHPQCLVEWNYRIGGEEE